MKDRSIKILVCAGVLAGVAVCAQGQSKNLQTGTPPDKSKTQPKAEKPPLRSTATPDVLKSPVVYSGYFVDLAKKEKTVKVTNLRAPVDKKRPYDNVLLEPNSNRVFGFKLFSIDF